MADTTTSTAPRAAAKTPATPKRVAVGRIEEIPATVRQGFWQTEFEDMKAQPGVIFEYEDVSPTTASNLRRMYGLDAHTRNTHKNAEGQTRANLAVRWVPDKAEAIKAEVKARGSAKRASNGNAAKQAPAKGK